MKTKFIAACITMGALAAHGQTDSTEVAKDTKVTVNSIGYDGSIEGSDTTRIEFKNSYITIVKKPGVNTEKKWASSDHQRKVALTWWDGIDIGVNGILNENFRTELPAEIGFLEPEYGRSRYIALNFGQTKARIVKDYVGFTTGLGVQFYNFKFSGDDRFVFGDSLFAIPSGEVNVTKSKLRATYLAVPAMLEFNTSLNPQRAFHISAGVVGKVRVGNMYKEKYRFDGSRNKDSMKGDMGLNRWQADAIVRVGYRNFTLFTQVGLIPLFDNKNTPDVYTFSAGLFIKISDLD